MAKEINLQEELQKFNFKNSIKVQFHQIDAIGILYNIQYFYLFENGRVDYLSNLGFIRNLSDIVQKFPVMTVNHRIDYLNFAEFHDEVEIFTRVSNIGTSSLIFENLAVKNGEVLLAKSTTAYVYINPFTRTSTPIPEEIKQKLVEFEKGNIILTSKNNENN
jgi:acyl-CoA thioester hydrolase